MYTTYRFLKLLFDDGEMTCFSTNPYGIEVVDALHSILDCAEFFSINPLQDSRRDANVTCYRNILIELDNMPLEQQLGYMFNRIPVTSITYSGGKSYHFIISLVKPCKTEDEYRTLVSRVYDAVPGCDRSCINPSRLSRLPGVIRASSGLEQKLQYLGKRVSIDELEPHLPTPPVYDIGPQPEAWTPTDLLLLINKAVVEPNQTMAIIGCDGRNAFFFWLGQRMIEAGFDIAKRKAKVEAAYRHLTNKAKFSLREAKHAARIRA